MSQKPKIVTLTRPDGTRSTPAGLIVPEPVATPVAPKTAPRVHPVREATGHTLDWIGRGLRLTAFCAAVVLAGVGVGVTMQLHFMALDYDTAMDIAMRVLKGESWKLRFLPFVAATGAGLFFGLLYRHKHA